MVHSIWRSVFGSALPTACAPRDSWLMHDIFSEGMHMHGVGPCDICRLDATACPPPLVYFLLNYNISTQQCNISSIGHWALCKCALSAYLRVSAKNRA